MNARAVPVLVTYPVEADPALGLGGTPRMRASLDALANARVALTRVDSVPAQRAHLLRVHDERYLARLEELRGAMQNVYAHRTILPGGMPAIRMAAGAVVQAVELVVSGREGTRAFCLVEPPGHHAEADRAGGFCVINNIAVGARHAQRVLGLARVMIVDWDVHHGNGTQAIFERDASVLFCDVHQHPLYPGSGLATEVGLDEGAGTTLNVPLPAGRLDGDYAAVFRDIVSPAAQVFRPELLLVSCGFDAHRADPLGGMKLSADGFSGLVCACMRIADAWCGGRLVLALEGGYNHAAVATCVVTTMRALSGVEPADTPVEADAETRAVIAGLRGAHPIFRAGLAARVTR